MPREAKHLRPLEMHQIAKTKTTSFGQTNNAPRSETVTPPQNAPNSKHQKLYFLEERTTPHEAKHLEPSKTHKIAKTKTTSFGGMNNVP